MKIDSGIIIRQYNANLKEYKEIAESVHITLDKAIRSHGIKYHSIDRRIKEIGSLLDKARRKKIKKPLEYLNDIVGLRVVCLFLSDIQKIENIINEEFQVINRDDKVSDKEPDIFGYMSLHLHACFKPSAEGAGTDEMQNMPFEIQVRTIAQDAWASISHHLDYKQNHGIPEKLKKDFHALSGLFYVADTHFSLLQQKQFKDLVGKGIR